MLNYQRVISFGTLLKNPLVLVKDIEVLVLTLPKWSISKLNCYVSIGTLMVGEFQIFSPKWFNPNAQLYCET